MRGPCLPSVPERAHVPQRDAEVPDGDRRRERQPVRRAVRHPLHADHVSAQTGKTYTVSYLFNGLAPGH